MIDFAKTTRLDVMKGNIPLHHDVILKVYQNDGIQYLTTTLESSATLVLIITSLTSVRSVKILSIEEI